MLEPSRLSMDVWPSQNFDTDTRSNDCMGTDAIKLFHAKLTCA